MHFTMIEKWFLKVLKVEYFHWHQLKKAAIPSNLALRLKILTPEKIFQILPLALAQVKAGNTSENLINKIRQIMYSLYRVREITKKV